MRTTNQLKTYLERPLSSTYFKFTSTSLGKSITDLIFLRTHHNQEEAPKSERLTCYLFHLNDLNQLHDSFLHLTTSQVQILSTDKDGHINVISASDHYSYQLSVKQWTLAIVSIKTKTATNCKIPMKRTQ